VWLLEAAGHGLVYVNGEPRTGDIYSSGIVSLPVALHCGGNHFLFQGGRGTVRIELVEPARERVFFNVRDVTLPDIRLSDQPSEQWGSIVVTNASERSVDVKFLFAVLGSPFVTGTAVPTLLPLSSRNIPFRWEAARDWRPQPRDKLRLEIAR